MTRPTAGELAGYTVEINRKPDYWEYMVLRNGFLVGWSIRDTRRGAIRVAKRKIRRCIRLSADEKTGFSGSAAELFGYTDGGES